MSFKQDMLIETSDINIIIKDELGFIQIVIESEQLDGILHLDYKTALKFANAVIKQST